MKKALLSLLFLFAFAGSKAQTYSPVFISFDDTTWKQHLFIDSLQNQHHLWQVGKPQKSTFTSAYSVPNAIVTDTTNSYPINDTSSFIIKGVYDYPSGSGVWGVVLQSFYRVYSDTLVDYGKIELSLDHGTSWIDLLNDTSFPSQIYWPDTPVFSGNSYGWQHFNVDVRALLSIQNFPKGDTLYYRFSFISDSVQTNKDGLMFDDLFFQVIFEGINDVQRNNLISVYPNPANDQLIIQRKDKTTAKNVSVEIYDIAGRLLYNNPDYHEASINTSQFANGMYMLKYSNGENFAVKKIAIQH